MPKKKSQKRRANPHGKLIAGKPLPLLNLKTLGAFRTGNPGASA